MYYYLIRNGNGAGMANPIEDCLKRIKNYSSVINVNPHGTVAYKNRAKEYENCAEYEKDEQKSEHYFKKAIKDYSAVIKNDFNNADNYELRAVAYKNRYIKERDEKKAEEYFKKAIEDYTKAIQKDSGNALRYNTRAVTYDEWRTQRETDKDKNIQYCSKAIEDYEKFIELYEADTDKYKDEQFIFRYQNVAYNYCELACYTEDEEKSQEYFEKAIEFITTGIEKEPKFYVGYWKRADLYRVWSDKIKTKDAKKAHEYLEKALEDLTNSINEGKSERFNYNDYLYRAMIYSSFAFEDENKNPEEYLAKAIEDYSVVVEKSSDYADFCAYRGSNYFNLAKSLENTNIEKAKEFYKKAVDDWNTYEAQFSEKPDYDFARKEYAENFIKK